MTKLLRFVALAFIAPCVVPAAAQVSAPDTVINGIRCERTVEYFSTRRSYVGDTLKLFIKKILPNGDLADFLPTQRFALVVRSPLRACKFIFPGGKSSLDTFNVSLPVRLHAAEVGTVDVHAFALMNGDASYLPLTVTSKSAEPYLLQQAAQSKMKHKRYEQARVDLMRASTIDSANRHLYSYDIACSYSLEGESAKALHWLRTSFEAGFDNYVHALKNDSDLEPLRNLPEFRLIVTGSLMRERANLLQELTTRPEFAGKNFVRIAGSFLKQGDIDSFYVSMESALKRGHVPGPDDFSTVKEFEMVRGEDRLRMLFGKYVSPVFMPGSDGLFVKSRKSGERISPYSPSTPIINPRINQSPSSSTDPIAMIVLRTGDSLTGNTFYALDWKEKTIKEIGHLSPGESGNTSRIRVNWKGIIAFTAANGAGKEQLFVRTPAGSIALDAPFHEAYLSNGRMREKPNFPPFELSMDAAAFVVSAKRELFVIDTADGTLFTQYIVTTLNADENKPTPFRVDTICTRGFEADSRFDRLLLGWESYHSHAVLFQDVYPQQLRTIWSNVRRYDPVRHSYTLLSPQIEKYLSSSLDGRYVLATNNDETCCTGINYSDNLLILYDTKSRGKTIVFDEWTRFGTRGKPEEHIPAKALLSPDGASIAAVIRNYYDAGAYTNLEPSSDKFRWGRVTAEDQLFLFGADGKIRKVLSDRDLIGWLDNTHLVLTQCTEEYHDKSWSVTHGEPRIFDITTEMEMPLLMTPAECFGIQWRSDR